MHEHDYFRFKSDEQDVMQLIFEQGGKLRPVSLSNIRGARFFPWHNNTFEDWFVDVNYVNHVEVWFVVDISGGFSDNDWHIERIS